MLRHAALLEIQNKDFRMTPLPLRTVRPFVIEEVILSEAAEETGLDLNDQMEITKYLKGKVSDFLNLWWLLIINFFRNDLYWVARSIP